MPRPALKPVVVAVSDAPALPQEDVARGPRSLSPPRFFRAVESHQQQKVDIPCAARARLNGQDGMTATARLRLDEASRLFPEAHRPPPQRWNEDQSSAGLAMLRRNGAWDRPLHQRDSKRFNAGLGARNRGIQLQGPTAHSAMLAPAQPAVPQASLCTSAQPACQNGRHTLPTPTKAEQVSVPSISSQAPGVQAPPSWGVRSSCFPLRAPSPEGPEAQAGRLASGLIRPIPLPTASEAPKPLGERLATIQLGALQAVSSQRRLPSSPRSLSSLSASLVSNASQVHLRARSTSPVPYAQAASLRVAAPYPPSPTVSPGASFRTVLGYVQPSLPASRTASPYPQRVWAAARSQSPVVAYRSVPSMPLNAPIIQGAAVFTGSTHQESRLARNASTGSCQKEEACADRDVPGQGSLSDLAKDGGVLHSGMAVDVTRPCQEALAEKGLESCSMDAPDSEPGQNGSFSGTNEEKEEAYILSAFRHNQQSTNERRVGAPQGTAAWRKAVADASIAAKAVLDGIPSTLEEAKHVEDSPPSVESLRATLQGLRAKDESTEPGAAKTTHKFGGMKHCYSDESTATALESAAVNLANAAAEAAIALEWRP